MFGRKKEDDSGKVTERKLREGKFDNLAPRAVQAFLGEAPKHVYDYGMQPEWKKRARQWAYEQQLPEFVYPVHGWSLGYGGPKGPITWFTCRVCGTTSIGSPYARPRDTFMCAFKDNHEPEWEVAGAGEATVAAYEALDGKADLMDRYEATT